MEKKPQPPYDKLTGHETSKTNSHSDMPVKTPATDAEENTAADEGLNRANYDNNKMPAGETLPGDE